MRIPVWNACTDADCTAWATSTPTRPGSTRASVSRRARATAERAAGDRLRPASPASSAWPNWAEMTAPTAAIESRPAIRAVALLIPEAMPAWASSASASTVAVSGATVAASPTEKISSAGSSPVR